jgi:hypothetical protein
MFLSFANGRQDELAYVAPTVMHHAQQTNHDWSANDDEQLEREKREGVSPVE